MRCKGMASERGWKAPFRSGAQSALRLPQAGPRDPLEPFQGIITSGGFRPSPACSVERPEDPHQQQHEKTLTTAAGVGVQPEEDVLTLAARAEVALQ